VASSKTEAQSGTAARPGNSNSPVAKKLLIKPGLKVGGVNTPPEFKEALGPLPEGAMLQEPPGSGLDVVIAFVRNAADVPKVLGDAKDAVKMDGLLWLCYLKGGTKAGTDLNRDILHAQVKGLGYEGVSLVSFTDAWSAMRFKPMK
jgi:hypothetical protein